MKFLLCLILLSCTSCYGHEKQFQKNNLIINDYQKFKDKSEFQTHQYYQRKGNPENYDNFREYYYDFKNYTNSDGSDEEYIGNPDFDAQIERPCRVFDLNCIRKFFVDHSNCKIRRGPLPMSFLISQESIYFSRVNITAIPTNLIVSSFRNSRIEEFYINRRTNKMVISINIRGFSTRTPSLYIQFYRSGREPIVLLTEGGQIYQSVTFTGIIPNIENLQLKEVELTAYPSSAPTFFLGPEIVNNTDPTVTQSLVEFIADLSMNTQESFLTDAQYYLPAYIQFNICDFGLSNL